MLIFYILKSGLSEPGCFRSVDLWYNSSDKGLIQIVIDKDWILRFCILIYPVLEKKSSLYRRSALTRTVGLWLLLTQLL